LQRLSAQHNNLETFDPAICNLQHLRYINFGDNEIAALPDEIHRLRRLETLILWSNVIGYYPATLMRLNNLKTLDLMHNEMSISEQERIINMFPTTDLKLSPPCNCTFDDDE
jgi:Leucine-rich repeat (LRR) protein